MKLPECNDDRSTGPIMGSGNAPIEEKKRKEKKTKKGGGGEGRSLERWMKIRCNV